ncbi:hypothetical protein Pan110_59460 [Gimesia panareensis]|nr:hypothetical protein Pan110_59460 [Gimesia panareensis]
MNLPVKMLDPEIFWIEHFFTDEECTNYLNYSEYLGYQFADVDVYGVRKQLDQIRNNERADIESQKTADDLWQKLQQYSLPETDLGAAIGLSPFIRFYRYSGPQRFNMHKDGTKRLPGLESRFTVLIYLNTVEEGGETVFRKNDLRIKPQAGCCLLFAHHLWHSGTPVVGEETKYVMRSDLLFQI